MHISGVTSPGRAVNGRLQPGHSSRRRCASSAGPEVTLLDYGAGNVRSVRNALNKLGCIVKEVCAASLAILRAHLQTLPAQSLNEPRMCIECVHFAGQPGSRRQLNACIHFMLATLHVTCFDRSAQRRQHRLAQMSVTGPALQLLKTFKLGMHNTGQLVRRHTECEEASISRRRQLWPGYGCAGGAGLRGATERVHPGLPHQQLHTPQRTNSSPHRTAHPAGYFTLSLWYSQCLQRRPRSLPALECIPSHRLILPHGSSLVARRSVALAAAALAAAAELLEHVPSHTAPAPIRAMC